MCFFQEYIHTIWKRGNMNTCTSPPSHPCLIFHLFFSSNSKECYCFVHKERVRKIIWQFQNNSEKKKKRRNIYQLNSYSFISISNSNPHRPSQKLFPLVMHFPFPQGSQNIICPSVLSHTMVHFTYFFRYVFIIPGRL